MLQLRDLPVNELKKIDISFEALSALEKVFRLKDRKNASIVTMGFVPKPIVIIDKDSRLNFNEIYDRINAFHFDAETEKYTYYQLYKLEPYGILGDDKICEIAKFELDIRNH